MRRLCVARDDEDHCVVRERPEADGPHVAEFLTEGGVHAVCARWKQDCSSFGTIDANPPSRLAMKPSTETLIE
jgi:hypothetical protein